jgi:hypothetical protein
METLPKKCVDINTVGSFCDCIAVQETRGSGGTGILQPGENR